MNQTSAKDIVELLKNNIDKVAQHLLPHGVTKGQEWCVGSINGEPGESLKICLSGDKKGVWKDFATEDGGDLLNLWCDCRSLDLHRAILEVRQWLGISPIAFESKRALQWAQPKPLNKRELDMTSKIAQYLINDRKLTLDTLQHFKIQEEKDQIIFPFYVDGKLTATKYLDLNRSNGKKNIRVEPNCQPCLFGWQAVPEQLRKLVLVEGEIDAMTLHQYGLGMAVLSVPFGGGTNTNHSKHTWIECEYDRLAIYDEIYLCLDNDQAGEEATKELLERLGQYRCRIVKLPFKDANECLMEGVTVDEMKRCFESAQTQDPKELKSAGLFVEEVIEKFYPSGDIEPGYSLPWSKADGKILFRPSELSVWTGITGHGKSQCLGHIMLDCMKQGAKVCIASFELKPKTLLYRLTRQAAALRNPTKEYIRAIHTWYESCLWIFDLVGTTKTKDILEIFKYARQRYGVDVFVIDSLMKCGIADDDHDGNKRFVDQLCDFKNQYNCHIHLVAHSKKGEGEKMPPGIMDVKGTGTIVNLTDNCFSIWRNKSKEEEMRKYLNQNNAPQSLLEQADCFLRCDKQRNGEWDGAISLWFDKDSLQYLSNYSAKPTRLVEYSKNTLNTERLLVD